MKYLNKSFSSGYNSKLYRDNFDKVFGINVEIELSEDAIDIIEWYAAKYSISFNEAVNKILREQLANIKLK